VSAKFAVKRWRFASSWLMSMAPRIILSELGHERGRAVLRQLGVLALEILREGRA